MGYNSVLFLCNDAIGQIERDPEGWWKKSYEELLTLSRKDHDGTYGFGNHANGFQAVSNQHADNVVLIAAGGNYATVIDTEYGGWNIGHHTKEGQIKLLEAVLKRLKKEVKKR